MEHAVYDMTIRIEETAQRSAFEVLRKGARIAAGFVEIEADGLSTLTVTDGELWKSMQSLVHKLWTDLQRERFGCDAPKLIAEPLDPAGD